MDETQHSKSEPRRGRERKRKRKGGKEKEEGEDRRTGRQARWSVHQPKFSMK